MPLLSILLLVALPQGSPPPPAPSPPQAPATVPTGASARAKVLAELSEKGVHLDLERRLIELDGQICQREEPLEYLLVIAPRGKDHESLLSVSDEVDAAALNTAMLLLGAQVGKNGKFVPVEPPPTREEYEAGAPTYTVEPASGDGFYLYVAWEGELADGSPDPHFYRAEDLVLNVRDQRSYQRGKWVYLGSRFIKPHKDAKEMFAADAEGNLVSLCYFDPADHLLTGADPEADNQYIWYPNLYLMPALGAPVRVIFSREVLEQLPAPVVVPSAKG